MIPENYEAWILWDEVKTQWRASGFGIIGLDYVAVHHEAARLGIELTQQLMSKIKALEAFELRRLFDAGDNSQGSQSTPEKNRSP